MSRKPDRVCGVAVVAVVAAGAIVLAAAQGSAHGAVVVDVASADAASAGPGLVLVPVEGLAPRTGANDFSLTSTTTIEAVSFFTLETSGQPWSGGLDYYLLEPDGLFPSSNVIAQGSVNNFLAEIVFSDAGVVRRLDFNLNAPVTLDPGTYWLALFATRDSGAGTLAWRSVQPTGISASTANTDLTGWGLAQGEAAFQLHDTTFAIPEPTAMTLMLGGLALLRRRRRFVVTP